jgi:TorA specific chaperone
MELSRNSASPESGWNALLAEWLAGLFMAPLSPSAVANYRDGFGATLLDILADELGCESGAQRMRSALTTDASTTAVARKLSAAFTRLFDGVGGHRTVSLYESAHVSASGRLFQAPASDIGLLLRQANMSTDSMFREPPDHLSIELALLAQMIRQDRAEQAQITLLDDHLLAWVPIFADRCCAADSTGFYAGAASTLTGFLLAQRAALRPDRTRAARSTTPTAGPPRAAPPRVTPQRVTAPGPARQELE